MRIIKQVGATCCIAFLLASCAGSAIDESRITVRPTSLVTATTTRPVEDAWRTVVLANAYIEGLHQQAVHQAFGEWVDGLERQARERARVRIGTAVSTNVTVTNTGSGGCGGDLPPCYVMQRESGGSYTAFNPTGCGGSSCYGKWQFSGEWAGKLGLPADLSQATPEQQDTAARILWNNGAGCSNWGAC